jgi:glucosamine-phosphate N-acetyltransferase
MTDVLSASAATNATPIPHAAAVSGASTGHETLVINEKSTIAVPPTTTSIVTEEEEPLFSPSLISPEIQSVLPEGYAARPLRRSDFHLGYLDVLRVLTTVGDITEAMWNDRFDYLAKRNDEYYLIVICDGSGRIVGTGSLIVERKFIHALGLVGHIEDIAVSTDQQGKKLGLRIIQTLDFVAAKVGCYKVRSSNHYSYGSHSDHIFPQSILDCSEVNEGFYIKCGFKRAGLEMAHYY